jgi:regulator of sigma E protease
MNDIVSLVWSAACFLLVIGPLIFIHELGHYFVGRWCGVKAEAFSIGFGRELVGWTDSRGTRWKIAWMPLGGYVRFAGDMGPASAPSAEWLALPAAERAQTFQAKSVWQRFLIVLAGPATNFLFAFLVLCTILTVLGERVTPPIVSGVLPKSGAAAAGLQPGDRIVAIGGNRVDDFDDIAEYTTLRPDTTIRIDLVRAGQSLTTTAHTGSMLQDTGFGTKDRVGLLGVLRTAGVIQPVPLIDVPGRAVGLIATSVKATVTAVQQILTGTRSAKDLHGPIGVAQVAGSAASTGWFTTVLLMAGISVNLGFINLLPIPMLDGGHLLFYLVEAARRKPVEPQVQEWAFRSGLALLLGLMLFVTFNDLGTAGLWERLAGLIG